MSPISENLPLNETGFVFLTLFPFMAILAEFLLKNSSISVKNRVFASAFSAMFYLKSATQAPEEI